MGERRGSRKGPAVYWDSVEPLTEGETACERKAGRHYDRIERLIYMIDSYSVRIVDIQHSNIRLVVNQFKGQAPGQRNVKEHVSKKITDENNNNEKLLHTN